jgi:hypothetical protein
MRLRVFVAIVVAVAIGLATAVAPFASTSPDGLNRVAKDEGFAHAERGRDAPAAGYAFPGIHDQRLAKGTAGFSGTLVVLVAGYGLVAVAGRRRPAL